MMSEMKGVHLGSYWNRENDIVYLMAHELKELCDLMIVDPGIYSDGRGEWFEEDYSNDSERPIRWLEHEYVLSAVSDHDADFVIVNSGGMTMRPKTVEMLQKKGVVCIGISLSDPDVFPYNGRLYSHLYDLFYTNSPHSLAHQYQSNANVKLLPFAASPACHAPTPEVGKEYDVVIVGHARPERTRIVELLRSRFCVGVFGRGWGFGPGPVHGPEHARAINSGRVYLSFSQTRAGYVNVKVGLFEAAACRVLVISNYFNEMERYFKYGLEVVGYRTERELIDSTAYYLENEHVREWIAENCYERLLSEHTWRKRWECVLSDISSIRGKRDEDIQTQRVGQHGK